MARGTRSLGLIFDETRIEQDARFSYFDALDAKAGVVLGFAAAIAALIDPHGDILVDVARVIAVLGGATAVVSFWPRTAPQTDMRALRDLYLGAEPDFTRLALLDTRVAMLEEIDVRVRRKARLLRIAMLALATAALLAAVGTALE